MSFFCLADFSSAGIRFRHRGSAPCFDAWNPAESRAWRCPFAPNGMRGGQARWDQARFIVLAVSSCWQFQGLDRGPRNLVLAARHRVGHIEPYRRCGRVAEGGGLLNRYRVVKPYRGFESLRLRQPSPCGLRLGKPKSTGRRLSRRSREATKTDNFQVAAPLNSSSRCDEFAGRYGPDRNLS
jgi:hypothetical protein